MKRIVVSWAGPQIVGAAVNVLHFEESVTDIATNVLAAYQNLEQVLPTGVTLTVPDNGEFISELDGSLTGVWTEVGTGGQVIAGSGTPAAAAGVGACVTWLTGGVVNSHRVRGRTFLVPLRNTAFDVDGTLSPGAVTFLTDFADDMLTADIGVWSRPYGAGGNGSFWPATSHRLRDKVAFLSTRRD